jgi:Xaa-Pro dipeptidase
VHELAAMRKAVEIAQRGLQATIPSIRRGVSEQELASELTLQLLRAGSNPEFPFTPIVSTGPNSANPHASPSSKALSEGDLLVIDWGATWEDYISDLTRTFGIGNLDAEFIKIAEIVKESNAAGLAAARPGVTAGSIDRAARTVIENAGYGHYFTHRTGHGVGMEGHEPPYIRGDNPLVLEPGMTFTIEPGIYLPGKGGVRIEDNVVITHDGAESLSDLPRDLFLTP